LCITNAPIHAQNTGFAYPADNALVTLAGKETIVIKPDSLTISSADINAPLIKESVKSKKSKMDSKEFMAVGAIVAGPDSHAPYPFVLINATITESVKLITLASALMDLKENSAKSTVGAKTRVSALQILTPVFAKKAIGKKNKKNDTLPKI
jgi:hypothetical protein